MIRKIPTLTGLIEPSELGKTYVHEHILTNPPPSRMRVDEDYKLDDAEKIIAEVKLFEGCGGRTIVDCTALDYGRDVKAMQEVAKQVSANILCITGFNRGDYVQWVIDGNSTDFAKMMLKDIVDGMDGTDVTASLIKIGTSYNNILPSEYEIMDAAAIAHKESGIPLITHTTLGTMGWEQITYLDSKGVDPQFVALSHVDQNLDFYQLCNIAKAGAYLEFDGPSKVKYAPDSARVEMLMRLCDAGLEDNILISGDMGRKSYLASYGGGPGFEFLLKKFAPRLLAEGFTQELVDKFFCANPQKYLSTVAK